MIAINYSEFIKNFKTYCDKVIEDFESIIITRKNNKNVVLISEVEYNNLMENLYIRSNPKFYNELIKRIKDANENSKTLIEHDIIEVD